MFYGLKIKDERLKFTTKAYGSTPKRSFTPTLHKSKRYSSTNKKECPHHADTP